LFVFKTCHNHIYANDGMQKQPAFFELLKVFFVKLKTKETFLIHLNFTLLHLNGRTLMANLQLKKNIEDIRESKKAS